MSTLLQQLEQLAPLAAAATPGDWQQSHRKMGESYFTQVYNASGETIATLSWHAKPIDETGAIGTYRADNAAYIAAARNLLTPANLALLIAQQAAPVAGLTVQQGKVLDDVRDELTCDDGAGYNHGLVAEFDEVLAALAAAPAAPVAGGAFGVQLLPAAEGPGATLWGEHLYVLLPDGTITQAMWCDFFTNEHEGDAWGHYTDVDEVNPLPVQPTHYFTPPTAPADAA